MALARGLKYGNRPTIVDGIRFHSKKEAKRYIELKLLESTGLIENLILQKRFPILINGVKICTYVADFVYYDVEQDRFIVEDVKGYRTAEYEIKKGLMLAINQISILES